MFRKNRKHSALPPHKRKGAVAAGESSKLHRVDFEMMLKGSTLKRRGKPIRQFGVTVKGSTRLVTSGDVVDEETYQALIACGAIAPAPAPEDSPSPAQPVLPEESSKE